jgi:hypothetical protein
MIRTKDDIEFHGGKPAVNVKVDTYLRNVKLPIGLGGVVKDGRTTWTYTDPEFTAEWVGENLDEEAIDFYFWEACREGFEQLQEVAEDIWYEDRGWYSPKVWSEGRSGGWAVVDGLPDVENWDAVMLGKWRRFTKYARAVADGVPEQMMTTIYINRWEKV